MRNGLIVLVIFLCGCMPKFESYVTKQYIMGIELTATVGSVMMAWEYGTRSTSHSEFINEGTKKELIYSGTDKGVVLVAYREYYLTSYGAAYARQPFYQNLRYDLDSSKIITFQTVKIGVRSADSEKIRYIILAEPADAKMIAQPSPKNITGERWGKDSVNVFYRDSVGNTVGQKIER